MDEIKGTSYFMPVMALITSTVAAASWAILLLIKSSNSNTDSSSVQQDRLLPNNSNGLSVHKKSLPDLNTESNPVHQGEDNNNVNASNCDGGSVLEPNPILQNNLLHNIAESPTPRNRSNSNHDIPASGQRGSSDKSLKGNPSSNKRGFPIVPEVPKAFNTVTGETLVSPIILEEDAIILQDDSVPCESKVRIYEKFITHNKMKHSEFGHQSSGNYCWCQTVRNILKEFGFNKDVIKSTDKQFYKSLRKSNWYSTYYMKNHENHKTSQNPVMETNDFMELYLDSKDIKHESIQFYCSWEERKQINIAKNFGDFMFTHFEEYGRCPIAVCTHFHWLTIMDKVGDYFILYDSLASEKQAFKGNKVVHKSQLWDTISSCCTKSGGDNPLCSVDVIFTYKGNRPTEIFVDPDLDSERTDHAFNLTLCAFAGEGLAKPSEVARSDRL